MSDPDPLGRGSDPSPFSFPDATTAGPLDSDVAVGLLQRGQVLAEQGDWDLASSTFARVIGNSDPALHTAALLGLAESRYRLDDETGALKAWLSATQAPENPLTWRAWKALAAARVRGDDVPGAARAYREAARRAPSSEQAEIQSRIGWLSKELGDEGAARRAFGRSRTAGVPQPIVTFGLLAVIIATSATVFFLDPTGQLESLLLLDKRAVYVDAEYWRFFTPVLVHGNFLHLAFNMYALWIIGPIVEALYGSWRYLGIFLLCAAAGSAASYVVTPNASVGASGAVFGLFGVLLVADRVHKPALTRNARNITMQIGVLIAINLFIGFAVPRIDNAAHIGGLLAGAWLGFVAVPRGARLSSFWMRPGTTSDPGSPSSPLGPGSSATPATSSATPATLSATRDPAWLLRLGGVALLVGVIVVLAAIGPILYDPLELIFFPR